MSYKIDCLKDGSPYAKEIKELKDLYKKSNFLDKNISNSCNLVIDLYEAYLTSVQNPVKSIEIFKKKLKKIIILYSKKKNTIKERFYLKRKKEIKIENHYSNLFLKFDKKNIFNNPKIFLTKRFKRNKIETKNFKNMNAIDMGCGIGRYTFVLKDYGFKDLLGIDISKKNINFANKLSKKNKFKNIKFKSVDIFKLRYNKKFDFAFSYGSFHHTKSISKCVGIMKKVLKLNSEGFLYLSHKGGIRWAVVQFSRFILKNFDRYKIYQYFFKKIKDTKKVYLILDHILVPINTLTTPDQIERILIKHKINNFRRLKRGSDKDDIELIYKYKKKISKKNLYYIFGYGENRYYFKINDKK